MFAIIMRSPGYVYEAIIGTSAEIAAEIASRNETDDSGSTTLHAEFDSREDCEREFYLLTDR